MFSEICTLDDQPDLKGTKNRHQSATQKHLTDRARSGQHVARTGGVLHSTCECSARAQFHLMEASNRPMLKKQRTVRAREHLPESRFARAVLAELHR
jgi:hypothetical protein